MEQEKIAKFYSILYAFKGRLVLQTFQNEEYREAKIYNFWTEFNEKLTMIWMVFQRLYQSFLGPFMTTQIHFDRIISRFAFFPPQDTYVFDFDIPRNQNISDDTDIQSLSGEILLSHFVNNKNERLVEIYRTKFLRLAKYLDCFYTFSEKGNRIACIFVAATLNNKNRKTIVYSHTNGEDIGTCLSHLWKLKRKSNWNVFAYDYSGYGMSSGTPSEQNLYADVKAAVEALIKRKQLTYSDLVLFGESIGNVPTIYLATKINPLGVIIQSSFTSGMQVYCSYAGQTLPFDPLPNIERVSMIEAPTLVVHGSEDMLADISQAVAIYKALKNPVTPFWANKAAHMNIHKHTRYYDRINYFLECELRTSSPTTTTTINGDGKNQ